MMGIEPHHNRRCGVAVREPKSIPIPLPDGTNPIQAHDLFHTSNPAAIAPCDARGAHRRTNIRLNSP